jgi:hypothetical protein
MSVTIAHKPHAHSRLPWRTIAVLLVAAALAVVVLVLVDQPWETQSQTASVSAVTTAGGASAVKADVPRNRSPFIRAILAGGTHPAAPAEAPTDTRKTPHWPRHK